MKSLAREPVFLHPHPHHRTGRVHLELGRHPLAGLRKFIAGWGDKPDHPVLQDLRQRCEAAARL